MSKELNLKKYSLKEWLENEELPAEFLSNLSKSVHTKQSVKFNKNKFHSTSIFASKPADNSKHSCDCCQVKKTPQWRRGPNGKNSLCNACGIKFGNWIEINPQSEPTEFFDFIIKNKKTVNLNCT